MLLSKKGILHSPDFPGHYPSNLRCKWTLVAERDCDYVYLNFTHIILERNRDTLKICLKEVCREDEKLVLTGKPKQRLVCMYTSLLILCLSL